MDDWKWKELWRKRGKGFCVEVSHHTITYPPLYKHGGRNRWCVYAYIYPAHSHFAAFDGDELWQQATKVLPLHGGASLLRRHQDKSGKLTSVQVGADYNHDGDEEYTHCDEAEAASKVFWDADELVTWLAAAPSQDELEQPRVSSAASDG